MAEKLISKSQKDFFQKIYSWMFWGLVLSAIMAVLVSSSTIATAIVYNPIVFFLLIIIELAFVFILSGRIGKIQTSTAVSLFIIYAILNGATLSVIFLAYNLGTISLAFFVTAGMFGVISLYGMTTKSDLSNIGPILFMGLIGLIIALVINLFFQSSLADLILAWIGVAIFTGLMAYDTWKIKHGRFAWVKQAGNIEKASILGALQLYLDFVNLFLSILRILGRRNN